MIFVRPQPCWKMPSFELTSAQENPCRITAVMLILISLSLPAALGDQPLKHSEVLNRIQSLERKRGHIDSIKHAFEINLELARLYQSINDVDKAGEYNKIASELPHTRGFDQFRLLQGWEWILKLRPFNPSYRIGLGEAFESGGLLTQAELEYRQAIYLSGNHHNLSAEKLLAAIRRQKQQAAKETPNPYSRDAVVALEQFQHNIEDQWRPPPHQGFLLTRCKVFVNSRGDVLQSEILAQSGSTAHDDSALEVLRSVKYTNCAGFPLPFLFDFGLASADGRNRLSAPVRETSRTNRIEFWFDTYQLPRIE